MPALKRTQRKMISALHGHSGKGDHDRINLEKFQAGYDGINWHHSPISCEDCKRRLKKPALTNSTPGV